MPEWPKKLDSLGTRAKRVDGPAKVSGQAKYSSDVQPEGWLYGMIFRSKWPAGLARSINLDKARAVPGIKAAITVKEGQTSVHFYGQELAAVAGTSKQACLDALRAITVDFSPQPFVVEEALAMKPDAPRVFADTPNFGEAKITQEGDIETAFQACAAVVEGEYSTQVQIHNALETHGSTILVTPDEATVWASTQGIFSVRDGLADNLDMAQSRVKVITEYMGGGFGAKFGPGVEGMLAARLSQETNAPVKLMLTRFEENLAVGNRPSSFQKLRLGADKNGRLLAYDLDAFGSAGFASGGRSAGGGGGAGFPSPYIYKPPNFRARHVTVAINAGSARAFRAPGHLQASFGVESAMDELAARLGMDPIELRIKNDTAKSCVKAFEVGREKFGWAAKYQKAGLSPGPIKKGVGVAAGIWGGGGKNTKAECAINPDGTVTVRCGTQDLGTGIRTVALQVAAEVFGIPFDRITVEIGRTEFPPSGGSGGSTTTASVAPAIYVTCLNALNALQGAAGMPDARGANFDAACRKLGVDPLVEQGQWEEGLSSSGTGGAQFAEVSVDTETGFVKVDKILVVQGAGLVANPLTFESQVNGGVIMGLGYALYENRVLDPQSGVMLNPNFETYKVPGGADIPEIEIVVLSQPERGVIGVGEPVTVPTAAAVANAVANALGVRINSLPITPDKVLEALDKLPSSRPSAFSTDIEHGFAAVEQADAVPGEFHDEIPS